MEDAFSRWCQTRPVVSVAALANSLGRCGRGHQAAGSKINLFKCCQIRVALGDSRLKGQCLIFRLRQRRNEIRPADGTAIGFVRHRTVIFIPKEAV